MTGKTFFNHNVIYKLQVTNTSNRIVYNAESSKIRIS